MKRSRLALVLLALCTCGVESIHPLSPPEKSALDKALLGTWVGTDKKERVSFEITQKSGGVLRVVLAGDRERDRMEFHAHVTQLGALKLLNLQAIDDGKGRGDFMFVRYTVRADGTLEAWTMREKVVNDAIKKGTLHGRSGSYGGVVLSDPPETLAAFIQSQKPEVLFEALEVFSKKP